MITTVKRRSAKRDADRTKATARSSGNVAVLARHEKTIPPVSRKKLSQPTESSEGGLRLIVDQPAQDGSAESLSQRAQQLLAAEIEFVANRDFNQLAPPETWEIGNAHQWRQLLSKGKKRSELAEETDVSRLCETHLLSAEEEVRLFRTMNQLKFGAVVLRERLHPTRPSQALVERIETMLAQAQQIRNHIVQANVRLVVAIVKRLTGPQHDFDDFVSDGMLSLMQVVEKFDFDRGFRFSTYAYRALTRTVFRKMASVHKQEQRAGTGMDEALMEVPGRLEQSYSEGTWKNLKSLLCEFMQHLDRRERHIVYARYALGFCAKAATFQALADELGVSKERVRQLERRAMDKLQALAENVDLDQFVEASRLQ